MSKSQNIRQLIEAGSKYSVLLEFDEGANGYAFKAVHEHLSRDVFLKVIDADPEVEKTFAEPKALMEAVASGDCENLVRLYDAEHLGDDYVLMSMEFVEGGSLNNEITSRSLGQMEAVWVAMGILAGVGHLHNARFLHRDVKPGNVLIKTTNTGRVPKLGDFGSARRLDDNANRVSASRHSALYRPAEAWGDDGWFSFSSDLYQVGICLYEMVNGPFPYTFEAYLDAQSKALLKERGLTSIMELDPFERSQVADGCVHRRINTGKLLNLTPAEPYLSPRLAKIIRKATSVDPANRYQSAFEFRNDLQAFSAPNWKPSENIYLAEAWKGWDWRVHRTGSKETTHWRISRARQGTEGFRSFGETHVSAKEACKVVESF